MPIYLHLASLVIAKSTIEEKYHGGTVQFKQDLAFGKCPRDQEDNELFSLAAMNCDEFDVQKLIDRGLHFDEGKGHSDDFVIISRYGGCLWEVPWLTANSLFAWHRDCQQEEMKKVGTVLSLSVAGILKLQMEDESPLTTIRM